MNVTISYFHIITTLQMLIPELMECHTHP